MVIHQGGTETSMPASAGIYLPDGWLSHCTTSGYMDRAGVRALAQGFVQHSGASAANPQYLYWDGHDSHWDADALDYFAKNHVFVFFLKANDSANDQPNDMGPNRNWKAIYATVVGEWQAAHPMVSFTMEWMNMVIVETWERTMGSATSAERVRDGFAKAGIFPFRLSSEYIEPEQATVADQQ